MLRTHLLHSLRSSYFVRVKLKQILLNDPLLRCKRAYEFERALTAIQIVMKINVSRKLSTIIMSAQKCAITKSRAQT